MNVYCFAVDVEEGAEGGTIVVALADTPEEGKAKVMTKFSIDDTDRVQDMHLPDVLGDFYDCVAILE